MSEKKKSKQPDKELGIYTTENGWKVQVILVDDKNLVLVGKKGRKDLTKKYVYAKVKDRMENGLEEWVKYKFSFEN